MSVPAQLCPRCGATVDSAGPSPAVCGTCGAALEPKADEVVEGGVAGPAFPSLDLTISSSSTPERDPEPTRPQLPGYELIELLGKGGMGEVWKARQTSLDRDVAVKVLPERFANDPEFVARFEKETKALAALSHPNIVQIIDRGRAGQHYFFTMELVRGTNLRELLRSGLKPSEALRVGAQVARAIAHAHHHRVVHRDLKPENVLVDAARHVKIADFGLAGMPGHERNLSLTATAVAMGTVNYMAPEQRRDAKHVDHRADLYSLGVLLYEMLTQQLPLGRFKPVSSRVADIDPRVDELIGQLLEGEPESRPHDASVVVALLDEVTGSSPSQPFDGRTGSAVVPPPSARARRLLLGMAVLALMVVGGLGLRALTGGGVSVSQGVRPPQWYQDSQSEVFSVVAQSNDSLDIDFSPSSPEGEKINTHSGVWKLTQGRLEAIQYGDSAEDSSLIPRAYLATRYFLADDFEASVDLELEQLPSGFPPLGADANVFAELAFRLRDTQVSVFAIPGSDMRLSWRYFTRTDEFAGSSAKDREAVFEEPVRAPRGVFRVKLKMTRLKGNDVNVEAWVNGVRFARKVLEGLAGQTGKVALGCRNLVCRFDNLKVSGRATARPTIQAREGP